MEASKPSPGGRLVMLCIGIAAMDAVFFMATLGALVEPARNLMGPLMTDAHPDVAILGLSALFTLLAVGFLAGSIRKNMREGRVVAVLLLVGPQVLIGLFFLAFFLLVANFQPGTHHVDLQPGAQQERVSLVTRPPAPQHLPRASDRGNG